MHGGRMSRKQPMLNKKEQFIKDNPPKDGIGLIPLTHGKYAIVDESDYYELTKYHWSTKKDLTTKYEQYYAYGVVNGKCIFMHRLLLNPQGDEMVDHKNYKGWDNRRENIRIATALENSRNSRKPNVEVTSQYKGVGWDKHAQRWKACVYLKGGKKKHIGTFYSEMDAVKAFDKVSKELFGEFAYVNLK